MKYSATLLTLFIALLLLPCTSNAQIESRTTVQDERLSDFTVFGTMHLALEQVRSYDNQSLEDSRFKIHYKDHQFTHLDAYETLIIDNILTLRDLYSIIEEAFDSEDRSFRTSFIIEGQNVTVARISRRSVSILVEGRGHTHAGSRRQWERLFEPVLEE